MPLVMPALIALGVLGPPGPPPLAGGDGQGAPQAKIRFDMSRLNPAGLYGPTDGLRALHYAFCIPDGARALDEVRSIDSSLQVSRAPGRLGCTQAQLLCVGSTHQPGYRRVLAELARLPYVTRIEQAFFE